VSEDDEPQSWAEKLAAKREVHQTRGRVQRVLFVVTGAIVLFAGIAMLVLPGPGLVVMAMGLTMLAMEFAWAEHALERALEQAEKASDAAKETSRAQRIAAGVATVLGVAAIAAWGLLADIPIVPDP
jgi:uncharacterized protein (TIGR02611 family)